MTTSSMLSYPRMFCPRFMLIGPGWSRRDHADWYTVLTDPANDDLTDRTTIFIAIPNLYIYAKI